jgi:hypothetical protein
MHRRIKNEPRGTHGTSKWHIPPPRTVRIVGSATKVVGLPCLQASALRSGGQRGTAGTLRATSSAIAGRFQTLEISRVSRSPCPSMPWPPESSCALILQKQKN